MNSTKNANEPLVKSESSAPSLEDVIAYLKASPWGNIIREFTTIIDADDVQLSGVVLSEKKVYERELLPMDHIVISLAGLRSDLPRGIHETD